MTMRAFLRPRNKYGVSPSSERTVDGITFDSKKEARRYRELKLLQKSGEVQFFLRQVPFDLPGGAKYRCDFMILWKDGRLEFEDVKGCKTKEYLLKKKILEATYPVSLKET